MKNKSTIWVHPITYRWAQHRWRDRDVKIDNYISERYIGIDRPINKFTKTFFGSIVKRRTRLVRIDHETFERETATWELGRKKR